MSKENLVVPHTAASNRQLECRQVLKELWKECPIPQEELMINLGLYMRSSVLAKLFFLQEIYALILDIPGNILTFGTWWGQDIVVFDNLRAIYEPYNYLRRIVGFDTFSGYTAPSGNDLHSQVIQEGNYGTSDNYEAYLNRLMAYHESENSMGHIKKYDIVPGDVTSTVPAYFEQNKQASVALAYFDLALYEPTMVCLKNILPKLVKGSVIALDQFNSAAYPGETQAAQECFDLKKHTVKRSKFVPDRTFIIIEQ